MMAETLLEVVVGRESRTTRYKRQPVYAKGQGRTAKTYVEPKRLVFVTFPLTKCAQENCPF
jgi:hypothetical protein